MGRCYGSSPVDSGSTRDSLVRTGRLGSPELPPSLQRIVRRLDVQRSFRPEEMRQLLLEAAVTPEDLEPWVDYDHRVADGYGRTLAYGGANFEIMVMSWAPGDFSAIHDHGGAQWGAVQVFGSAEHACFRIHDGQLWTHARWRLESGEVVVVSHDLVHQMGNPSGDRFSSLHIYGTLGDTPSVTADTRVFDPDRQRILRVDGGVFFLLPPAAIKHEEPGPVCDAPTVLRDLGEQVHRLSRMQAADGAHAERLADAITRWSSPSVHGDLVAFARGICDGRGQITDSRAWAVLDQELKAAARLQVELDGAVPRADDFHRYADVYDTVIGQPCLDTFMAEYLRRFVTQWAPEAAAGQWLSIGCGTGLVEQHLADQLGVGPDRMLGIDVSEAMVRVASARTRAMQADLFEWDAQGRRFDVAFSGLNVFHYLDHRRFGEAVREAANLVVPGGSFVGDFITPDHVRSYPNLILSEDGQVASLRTPTVVEEDGHMFQESDIVNVDRGGGRLRVDHAGRHRRFLPPVHRVRREFERHFGGEVRLFDAHDLQPLPESADTCPSTRYVLVARKG